jgi:hypothetical protein
MRVFCGWLAALRKAWAFVHRDVTPHVPHFELWLAVAVAVQ